MDVLLLVRINLSLLQIYLLLLNQALVKLDLLLSLYSVLSERFRAYHVLFGHLPGLF